MTKWAGRKVTTARAQWLPRLPQPCGKCGNVVTAEMTWTVGHIVDRALGGSDHISNTWPEHALCNFRAGGKLGAARTNARRTRTVERLDSERVRGIRGI